MSRRFDKVLESATDQTLVEPNWESILECVDLIRGSDVSVKHAVNSIQKRYHDSNPHVAHHSLLVLEACVKNCGKKFHDEIATKDFMDDLKNIVIEGAPDKVKGKILELIQCWSSAFEKSPQYKIVCDTHSFMKMYGFEFPKLKEADAMFVADSAPEWADGDSCFRCRVEFGVFTRKHHCRCCGQIFCDRCSNRQMFLPRFGIEKKVRVCETCFNKSNDAATQKIIEKITQNGQQNVDTNSSAAEQARQRESIEKEKEELELALALSMSEAEAKSNKGGPNFYHQPSNPTVDSAYSEVANDLARVNSSNGTNGTNGPTNSNVPAYSAVTPTPQSNAPSSSEYQYMYKGVAEEEDDIDPALSQYLDRRYWEQRKAANESAQGPITGNVTAATAPPPSEMSFSTSSGPPTEYGYGANVNNGVPQVQAPNGQTNGYESSASNATATNIDQKMTGLSLTSSNDEIGQTLSFCANLREQVEIMDNRMRSNLMRGRSVINDSAIHSLFSQLSQRHADVLNRMTKLDNDREYFEGLQDHLAYIQEARQALVSLREEHFKQRQERIRSEQELRMQQMQAKLGQIRHKKHESLLENRQLALQRLQEQELQIQQRRNQAFDTSQNNMQPVDQQMQMPQQPQYAVTQGPQIQQIPQIPQIHPQYAPVTSHYAPVTSQTQPQYASVPNQYQQVQHPPAFNQPIQHPQQPFNQYVQQPMHTSQPYAPTQQEYHQSPPVEEKPLIDFD